MKAQHSSASNEHYTPIEIIDAARAVMGSIDLDPASCFEANQIVRATSFCTKEDDGLTKDWFGNVWLNPPGGKTKNKSNAAIWWKKLVHEYLYGHIEQAIFLGFSIEILQTTQDCELWPGELPFCIPSKRIDFVTSVRDVNGRLEIETGDSPTHANIIAYLPPLNSERLALFKFDAAFSPIGKVRT